MAVREFSPVIRQFKSVQRESDAERITRHGWQPFVACSFCGDTGYDPDTGRECAVCILGVQLVKRQVLEQQWPTIIPRRFVDYTLEAHPNVALAKAVGEWIDSNPCMTGENLVLQGGVGRGKTGAALAALRELHFQGAIVRYWSLPDLMDQLRADEFGRNNDDPLRKKPTMSYLQECDVLLLDDMGTERQTAYVHDRIYLIINSRYERNLPTIFTTNQNKQQFLDHLDPPGPLKPCASRIQQNARWVDAGGPDLRSKK
jgi:DNA replication protein DnaC